MSDPLALMRTLWDYQEGLCGACSRPLSQNGCSTVVDHDHSTGLVRGWLCKSCNYFADRSNESQFQTYRELPPAARLGVSIHKTPRLRHAVGRGPIIRFRSSRMLTLKGTNP